MPEGDSVFVLARRLRTALDGRTLAGGELRGGRAAGTRLDGRTVLEHVTHGKHLLTRFDGGLTLHTHLRMQGSWSVTGVGRSLPRAVQQHARVRMAMEDGRTAWGLDLPVVELLDRRDERLVVGHLGPDPLRDDFDQEEAVRRLGAAPARAVIVALADQRNLAGLGNLWVNELCFLQGLHPWSPVGDAPAARLVDRAARMLRASVAVPGMLQVTTGDRRRGRQHWVAGRAGEPCRRCGTVVRVRAEVRSDPERRRTWWCPRCQPASS